MRATINMVLFTWRCAFSSSALGLRGNGSWGSGSDWSPGLFETGPWTVWRSLRESIQSSYIEDIEM